MQMPTLFQQEKKLSAANSVQSTNAVASTTTYALYFFVTTFSRAPLRFSPVPDDLTTIKQKVVDGDWKFVEYQLFSIAEVLHASSTAQRTSIYNLLFKIRQQHLLEAIEKYFVATNVFIVIDQT